MLISADLIKIDVLFTLPNIYTEISLKLPAVFSQSLMNNNCIMQSINLQEGYYNLPTYEKSRATVVNEITKNLVAPIIGETNLAAYTAGFNDSKSDMATRISFKVRKITTIAVVDSIYIYTFAKHKKTN